VSRVVAQPEKGARPRAGKERKKPNAPYDGLHPPVREKRCEQRKKNEPAKAWTRKSATGKQGKTTKKNPQLKGIQRRRSAKTIG